MPIPGAHNRAAADSTHSAFPATYPPLGAIVPPGFFMRLPAMRSAPCTKREHEPELISELISTPFHLVQHMQKWKESMTSGHGGKKMEDQKHLTSARIIFGLFELSSPVTKEIKEGPAKIPQRWAPKSPQTRHSSCPQPPHTLDSEPAKPAACKGNSQDQTSDPFPKTWAPSDVGWCTLKKKNRRDLPWSSQSLA